MILTKETKIELEKIIKKNLSQYIEYKDTNAWKNDKGYIDKDNINSITFWIIEDIKGGNLKCQ